MSTSTVFTAFFVVTLAAGSFACSGSSNEASSSQGQTTQASCADHCAAVAQRCGMNVPCSEVCAQPNGPQVIACAEQASCDAMDACAAKDAPADEPASGPSGSSGTSGASSSSSSSGSPSSSSSSGSSGAPSGGTWSCDATASNAGYAGAQGEQCSLYRLTEVDPGAKCSTLGDKAMVRSSYYCLAKSSGYEVERRMCECK